MTDAGPRYRLLRPGDPAPWFRQRSTSNPRHVFDTAAGRWIVLCFFVTAGDRIGREALRIAEECRSLFDDHQASLFGVSLDPADEQQRRVVQQLPGIRHFWDFDGMAARAYGVLPVETPSAASEVHAQRLWFILDPSLRVHSIIPFDTNDGGRGAVAAILARLPAPDLHAGMDLHAPVLALPRVFEPDFCRALVDLYERHGAEDSGFMREQDGVTVGVRDYSHKRRADHVITDQAMIDGAIARIRCRLVPEIHKAFQFETTRMERYIVACYDAAHGGHFRPHRDNTTKGTAHRRFAVSINLNDGFDGGDLMFPEFGTRRYKPTIGAAVVFSCSLLHQVTPMTRGRRFAFLPFLYDEASARQREANNRYLDPGVGAYSAAPGTAESTLDPGESGAPA
jgi:peroxiredoxin